MTFNTKYGVVTHAWLEWELIPTPTLRKSIWAKRTWKERWFSLPFKPRNTHKIIGYEKDRTMVRMEVDGRRMILCSPEMIDEIKQAIMDGVIL